MAFAHRMKRATAVRTCIFEHKGAMRRNDVISHLLLAIFMKPDILSPNSHFVPIRFLVEVMIWKKNLIWKENFEMQIKCGSQN